MNAYPIVKDRPYEILQENTAVGRSMNHTIGASASWFMDKGRKVDISYYAKITDSKFQNDIRTLYLWVLRMRKVIISYRARRIFKMYG